MLMKLRSGPLPDQLRHRRPGTNCKKGMASELPWWLRIGSSSSRIAITVFLSTQKLAAYAGGLLSRPMTSTPSFRSPDRSEPHSARFCDVLARACRSNSRRSDFIESMDLSCTPLSSNMCVTDPYDPYL